MSDTIKGLKAKLKEQEALTETWRESTRKRMGERNENWRLYIAERKAREEAEHSIDAIRKVISIFPTGDLLALVDAMANIAAKDAALAEIVQKDRKYYPVGNGGGYTEGDWIERDGMYAQIARHVLCRWQDRQEAGTTTEFDFVS